MIGASRVRAILRRAESAEAYLRDQVSGGKLKELRRLERRLSEQEGGIEFSALSPHDEIEPALDAFLEVERSGWKGREGSAIACRSADEAFFRQAAAGLHAAGALRLHWLKGRDRAIASKCNFVAGEGSYAFKIGFVEEYARFSPGVQLEVDNIRRFHAEPELAWMDSCADPDHPMIDHLWKDRRSIHSWWIPLNRWGATSMAFYPWAASMRKGLRVSAGGKGEKP
jgi:CelD/BcsL family acetyltransferase involved in cellulose biosynthesis